MNKVLTAIDKSGSFRVYLTISTKLVQEALNIHNTTPVATAALGRVLTSAGMMGLMLKNERDKLTLIFKGDGPARQILATADGKGNVKGYIADPGVDLPLKENGKLDVGGAIGRGELTVVKDLGLKEPYVGTVSLVSGEIAEDLTSYYYISEQQNTAISLGVKIERDYSVGCAGGMIVQLLPDASEDLSLIHIYTGISQCAKTSDRLHSQRRTDEDTYVCRLDIEDREPVHQERRRQSVAGYHQRGR